MRHCCFKQRCHVFPSPWSSLHVSCSSLESRLGICPLDETRQTKRHRCTGNLFLIFTTVFGVSLGRLLVSSKRYRSTCSTHTALTIRTRVRTQTTPNQWLSLPPISSVSSAQALIRMHLSFSDRFWDTTGRNTRGEVERMCPWGRGDEGQCSWDAGGWIWGSSREDRLSELIDRQVG